ncbi:SpoIID/LytB domain-containing protein [Massilioclostridium coli]|uniref:SpoIID/LytB domain-containing protein n=1 Tax=Massilioclostridium coli TaxID=1870991 RepID=UPI0022E66540|nr:SpoIID/LytB domain-containing protein [Massilioclostridium coli]
MKRWILSGISCLCATTVGVFGVLVAYHTSQPVEPTSAELQKISDSITSQYASEPIKDPDDLEYITMSTEELVESLPPESFENVSSTKNQFSSQEYIPPKTTEQNAAPQYSQATVDDAEDNPSSMQSAASSTGDTGSATTSSIPAQNSSSQQEIDSQYSSSNGGTSIGSSSQEENPQSSSSSGSSSVSPPPSSSSSEPPSSNSSSEESSQTPVPPGGGDYENNPQWMLVSFNGKQDYYLSSEILPFYVETEMSSSWSTEALKAQAVASHTYAQYKAMNGQADVVPTNKKPSEKVKQICKEVAEEMVYYNGKPINAMYTAAMASYSRNSKDVFGGSLPYLVSVPSEYESLGSNWDYKREVSKDKFRQYLENWFGTTDLGLDGDISGWIKIINYTADGYVNQVQVGNRMMTGWELYKATGWGSGVRSAYFSVETSGDTFIFTTRGYGHCVGMSQWGAHLYAREAGWNYKQILTHYYSGTQVY